MTYQKLLLNLLAGSTLVLVLLWWLSVGTWVGLSGCSGPGGDTFATGVSSGTLIVVREETPAGRTRVNFHRWPHSAFPSGMHRVQATGFGHITAWTDPVTGEDHDTLVLSVPLWFAYLVFVGTTFVLVRALERRSVSGKEKMLVEKAAADRGAHGAE